MASRYPPLGTPMLAGFLKERGKEVLQRDFSMEYLEYQAKRIPANLINVSTATTKEKKKAVHKLLNGHFQEKQRKNLYYSGLLPVNEKSRVGKQFHSCAAKREKDREEEKDCSNASYSFTEQLLVSTFLHRYLCDEEENTFLQFYREVRILEEIEKAEATLLGISLTSPTQVIGALTLGRAVKGIFPRIHVTLGGFWPTLFIEELKKRPDLAACFDTIIAGEGETPLYELLEALEGKKELSAVPNLSYLSGGGFVSAKEWFKEKMNDLACPDFDGLPLQSYIAGRKRGGVALTYQSARECYWNKCAYCTDVVTPKNGYRVRSLNLVMKDIKKLKEKYDLKLLELSNLALSPVQMSQFSGMLLEEKIEFEWWCFARLEKGFDKKTFTLARKAGCSAITFGMESASQRVLNSVTKGTDATHTKQILEDCHASGINVQIQVIFGLPGETPEDALKTVRFLVENRKHITGVVINPFFVTRATDVFHNPSRYGVSVTPSPNPSMFQLVYQVENSKGCVSRGMALQLKVLYQELIAKKETIQHDSPRSP